MYHYHQGVRHSYNYFVLYYFQIAENILKLFDAVCRLIDMQLDSVESGYLKLVCLFSWHLPGLGGSVRRYLERLQEKAINELVAYENKMDFETDRVFKLLLRILPLRQLKVCIRDNRQKLVNFCITSFQ